MSDGGRNNGMRMALDALGARQGGEKYGDAVVATTLLNLITEGKTAPDINTDLQGAADHRDMIARNQTALWLGMMGVAELLLALRERETGQPPTVTLAAIRRVHETGPSLG